MKKNFKRLLGFLLSLALLSTCLGGMAMAEDKELTTIKITTIDRQVAFDEHTYYVSQLVDGTIQSRLWDEMINDLAAMGVALEWDLVAKDQYGVFLQQQVALGLDSDVIQLQQMDNTTRVQLANDGYFMDMMDMFRNYSDGTALNYVEEGWGRYNYRLQNIDGKLYWWGNTTQAQLDGEPMGGQKLGFLRKDWLDACGLEVPTNIEEFYQTLVAFRENDVNKTGLKDEQIYTNIGNVDSNSIAAYFGIGCSWYTVDLETNKVTAPWYFPGMKDYIKFMNKLYTEGLVESTGIASQLRAENKIGFTTEWTSFNPVIEVAEGLAKPQWIPVRLNATEDYTAVAIKQDGVQCNVSCAIAVNAKTEKAEAVTKLFDYMCSQKFWDLTNGGMEGVTYEIDPATGEKVRLVDTFEYKLGTMWSQETLPRFEMNVDRRAGVQNNPELTREFMLSEQGFTYEPSTLLEPYNRFGVGTMEEIERIAELKTDLETYMSETLSKLIMGEKSLDDWDTYMSDMDRLGLNELLEIYQAQYDRGLNPETNK